MNHIEVEGYVNYRGDLVVGIRFSPGADYVKTLNRAQAERLLKDLVRELEPRLGEIPA